MSKRLLRSLLSLMVCMAMLLSLAPAALAESADAPSTEMAVGAVIHGFEVVENGEFALLNAKTTVLRHQKTGATVFFLINEDTNRAFDISFVTPLSDDKGIPHVFEHSTLDGSKKYPSASLFFNLIYQTYNTYMNAATYQVMTTYPVASLSEAQLLRYADFYLDSCFNPMIYEDESLFRSEAWRYSLESADSPLTISGTVYSEMQGAASLEASASYNAMKAAFPGSHMGYNQGGEPTEIPSMTWQEVKDYHTAYYHPSNSLTTVYGAIEDPAAFLALLDEAFSPYEAKAFDFSTPDYTPVTSPVEKVCQYPVYEGTETENAAVTYITFICENATEEEQNVLDLLTTLLSDSSSALVSNLVDVLPNVDISVYLETDGPEPAVVFVASGMNEGDVTLLRDCIYTSVLEFAENGVSQDMLDAIASSLTMETALMSEESDLGVNMAQNIAYCWATTGDVHAYEKTIANMDNFEKYQTEGKYAEVAKKYLTEDNQRLITVTTVPAPGQQEAIEADLAAKLAETKAAMSAEEIDQIVADTAALASGSMDDASELVAQLQAVTVDNLPEEIRTYDYTDVTDASGIRRIDVTADVDGIGQTYILLDAAAIPQEDIHWLNLYLNLIGSLGTTEHSSTDVYALQSRYLYDGVVKLAVLNTDDAQGFRPYVRASWKATDADMSASYALLNELLFESEFTETALIASNIALFRQTMKQSYEQEIYMTQLYRAISQSDVSFNFYTYATGVDYYHFLSDAQALLESDPEAFAAKMKSIQALLHNGANAVIGFAGNAASIENNRAAADSFLASLPMAEVVPQTYDLPVPASAEGIVINSTVNFNLVYATFEQMGVEGGYSGAMDAMCSLVSDGLLYPLLRDQYGAYGVFHGADEDGMYIISYRDPNVAQTFTVYNYVPMLLQQLQMSLDQETLDGYILSSYSYYALSSGELTGALSVITDVVNGDDPFRRLQWMHELKQFKVEDIMAFAPMYQALLDNGCMSTAGSQSALNTMPAGTYENIIKP